ncbi:serine hydrolase [Pandoraea soli]|nr:serine hydrolase [Pandoraea soli]
MTLLVAGLPVSDALAVTGHHSGHGKRHLQPAKNKKTTSKPARRKAAAARAPHHRSAHHRAKAHAGRKAAKPARRAQTTMKHRANATRHHATPKASSASGTSRAAGAVRAAGAATNVTARVLTAAKPRLLARCGFTPASRKRLFSRAVYIVDENTKTPLFSLNANQVRPIASLSKLMTAVVWLDSGPAMRAPLTVTNADRDTLKYSHSRLAVGSTLSRADMLHISLMASENRAAAALSRDYPGGRPAFISAMNSKARALNMPNTRFANSTGLSPNNVSTARELARLVRASNAYPLIRRYSIDHQQRVNTGKGQLQYVNTNRLVRYGKVDASV